jgi:hypothetical protein
MEPCIDPAQEVQASELFLVAFVIASCPPIHSVSHNLLLPFGTAGRIHRLGQTKQVGVTKYVFEDSCESKVLELHAKIERNEVEYTSGSLSREALKTLRLGPEDMHYW